MQYELGRSEMIEKFRSYNQEQLFYYLRLALTHADSRFRGCAGEALLMLDAILNLEYVLALLRDEDILVRYSICENLGEFGDHRAVEPLIEVLRTDEESVRCGAAAALGFIGDNRAIPALKWAVGNDFGEDGGGYTVSFLAQKALTYIAEKR